MANYSNFVYIRCPFDEFNNTSSLSEHILAPIRFVFSGSFIAIFPFDCTFVKSESALRRTLPVDVAKKICKQFAKNTTIRKQIKRNAKK